MGTALFVLSLAAIIFNYAADAQPERMTKKKSLLLASGYWGQARHFQYLFELVAAWTWVVLANPFRNGVIPTFYAIFLTLLLIQRAGRDHEKCLKKYGKYWEKYCKVVPFKIIPYVY